MRRIAFTVDVEQDAPPYFATWRGMEQGFPSLLSLLERHGIPATFFVTGVAAGKFPDLIKHAAVTHEIGCHGYDHERYDRLPAEHQRTLIRRATDLIHEITGKAPAGFRAPNFRYSAATMHAIRDLGYRYDASRASYHPMPLGIPAGLAQIANTLPSSVLRLPTAISGPLIATTMLLTSTVVLDFHPWELVKMSDVRPDIRFATGRTAEHRLDALFTRLRARGITFVTMNDVAADMS